MSMPACPEVAVVGAGPAGCVTALAFARRGARVLLIEAQATSSRRLAGEWLHPPGTEVLQRLGVGPIPRASDHPAGLGFVVFPGLDVEPIVLPYPGKTLGLSCEHRAFVEALRGAATAHGNIVFLPCTRVTEIAKQRLELVNGANGEASSLQAGLIVGADGRSSLVRRCLGLPDERRLVSYMAGVLLADVELPFEGFGHVFLGGPGPAFVCRISPLHVRVCLDIPVSYGQFAKDAARLYEAYSPALPASLRAAFHQALQNDEVACTANQLRPRIHYGRPGLALVGDAVGHFHPLTAVGMTLAFLDGYGLATSKSFADYRRERSEQSCVAEMLANALYKMFTLNDEGAASLRKATYHIWQETRAERRRTMRLLSGEETDLVQFNQAFLRVLALAARQTVQEGARTWRWRHAGRSLRRLGELVAWLAAGNVSGLLRGLSNGGVR
ncbi:MAG TPA: FAD-dependent oxidoreductase [Gemmataceae bacterium]|nr:FAD-dependent oxidoreductase [Gemmataceae bacterium]